MSKAVLFTATDTWKIQGDLSFETTPELFDTARERMQERLPVCIDLESVERVESAGVALMLDWIRAAHARDRTLQFSNVPEHMRAIAELCGVGHLLTS